MIPTSTMEVPPNEQVQPTEDLVSGSLRHRAELVESRIQLNSRPQQQSGAQCPVAHPRFVRLLRWLGIGWRSKPGHACCTPANNQRIIQLSGRQPFRRNFTRQPVLVGTALNNLVNSAARTKGSAYSSISLRATARRRRVQIRSELEYRKLQMRLQQIENQSQHRGKERAIRCRTEPRQRRFRAGGGGLCAAVAGCRTEEVSVRHVDHDLGLAESEVRSRRRNRL